MVRRIVPVVLCLVIAAGCSTLDDAFNAEPAETESDSSQDSQRQSAPESEADDGADADPETEATPDRPGEAPGQSTPSTPAPAPAPVPAPSISDDELTLRLSELGGRLAVGNGPELAVVRPDGAGIDVIDGSETVLASQPTWSHDGQHLAWSSISAERQVVQVQRFDEDGLRSEQPQVTDAPGNPVFYLQWNEGGDRLAYIRNAPDGGSVEVGVIEPGLPIIPVGLGAPFFISWSPAPDRLLGHVDESSIESYDVQAAAVSGFTTVTPVTGGFSAPVWVDDRRALIASDERLWYLDVESGAIEAIIELDGPVRFVLSPDRKRLAFQRLAEASSPTVIVQPIQQQRTGLVVLDLETLDRTLVTSEIVLAWEWSPDGQKLAWLEGRFVDQRPAGRWHFWSGDAALATTESQWFSITRRYGQSYLPFFAQYAQSVTGWAPDSLAYAFAGRVNGERGVWIQLIDEVVSPRNVAPGDFVTWGPGQPPPPSQGASAA
ncbi:MAG: hypothetical protein ACRBK7_06875 [Acidimicrobiales bacterium]